MACADYAFPVDGRGSGRGEGRHEQKGARGDGDCEPTRGADAASHRLSFLARHRAVNKELPETFPERLTGLSPGIKILLRKYTQNAGKRVPERSGTFRNMLQ